MTGSDWDERTEAIPGKKGEKSFELDLELEVPADEDAGETLVVGDPRLAMKSVVVFEPAPLGIAAALAKLGYTVRAGATGVDVMGLVAGEHPAVVVCAPAPDPERRRLLSAALRLRFPAIPVLYVSTHAGQEEAVLGAIREGARAVIAWPLPAAGDVARVLGPYLARSTPGGPGERRVVEGAADDDEAIVTPARPIKPTALRDAGDDDDDEPVTAPHVRAPQRPPPPSHRGASTDVKRGAPPTPASSDAAEDFEDARTDVTALPQPPVDVHAPMNTIGRASSSSPQSRSPRELPLPRTPSSSTMRGAVAPAPVPLDPGAAPLAPVPVSMVAPVTASPFQRQGVAGHPAPLAPPELDEPTTQPNDKRSLIADLSSASANAVLRSSLKRGEIGSLLSAVSPFLWSLEDAARWADERAAAGDPAAQNHARALHLLARILVQLQNRIDDIGA